MLIFSKLLKFSSSCFYLKTPIHFPWHWFQKLIKANFKIIRLITIVLRVDTKIVKELSMDWIFAGLKGYNCQSKVNLSRCGCKIILMVADIHLFLKAGIVIQKKWKVAKCRTIFRSFARWMCELACLVCFAGSKIRLDKVNSFILTGYFYWRLKSHFKRGLKYFWKKRRLKEQLNWV